MAFKPITVNTPAADAAHIYAQDDAAIYESIFGGDGVFNIGSKLATKVLSNNKVRVSDGVLCVGGHVGRMEYADYQDMTIENGASGYNRNDIIYARFLTSGDVDTFTLLVKKGTATTGTAQDPAFTKGNLYQGAKQRDFPLWRVKLTGLSITKVEQMFSVIPTIPELLGKYNELNTDMRSLIKTAVAESNPSVTVSANSATKINVPLPQVAGFTPIDCISLRSITNGMTVSGMTINSASTSIDVTAVNLRNESVNFNEITLFVLYTLA